jgi:large subunit ribosomal protein L6
MSRIGNMPITIPNGVQVSFASGLCTVKGPKGELTYQVDERIKPSQEGDTLTFSRENELKTTKAMHGLTRARVAWMVEGVSAGFEKALEIQGVGFKVELRGRNPILFMPPDGIEFNVASPTAFSVKGIDKQLVGQIAAKARSLRKPEPYKGKGVRYAGEYIRRKAGKAAGK